MFFIMRKRIAENLMQVRTQKEKSANMPHDRPPPGAAGGVPINNQSQEINHERAATHHHLHPDRRGTA
ncbi:MAG TPA: hypothetical protein PKY40_15020, partial [Burkholderiaceae bacterium]|nr:hypothetical protein [Burkholderiaceae bacterium]